MGKNNEKIKEYNDESENLSAQVVKIIGVFVLVFMVILGFVVHAKRSASADMLAQEVVTNSNQASDAVQKTTDVETGVVVFDKGASFTIAPSTKSPPVVISEAEVLTLQNKGKSAVSGK